jgi:hypothetical protein
MKRWSVRLAVMIGVLAVALGLALWSAGPASADVGDPRNWSSASLLSSCAPGEAMPVGTFHGQHVYIPSLPKDTWAGTIKMRYWVDEAGYSEFKAYCTQLHVTWGKNQCHQPYEDSNLPPEVIYILIHYGTPANAQEAAAIQLAIWSFTDSVDISEHVDENPTITFDRAREIRLAALNQAPEVPKVPASLTLEPSEDTIKPLGASHTVTVTVKDQGGIPLAGIDVEFQVVGPNNYPLNDPPAIKTTDGDGQFTYEYTGTGTQGIRDMIQARLVYTAPVGLEWVKEGKQHLIMGEERRITLQETAMVYWSDCDQPCGYDVAFVGEECVNGEQIWTYTVTRLAGSQDLSHFTVGICKVEGMVITPLAPTGSGISVETGTFEGDQYHGIKWNLPEGFFDDDDTRTFSFKLNGCYEREYGPFVTKAGLCELECLIDRTYAVG